MAEPAKIVLHPFYVECLLFILDAARPGPGRAAQMRLSELWEKVHVCLWPGIPVTEQGSRWLNPTMNDAQLEAHRRSQQDQREGDEIPKQFDRAATLELVLSPSEVAEAKKHVEAHLDEAQLFRVRMVRPLLVALEKAAG